MFDIVIPTMWRSPEILQRALSVYMNLDCINYVLLVDNDPGNMPAGHLLKPLLESPKCLYFPQAENIYVNPAWNLGVDHAVSDYVAILNDDILVNPVIFEFLGSIDWSKISLIGCGGPSPMGLALHQLDYCAGTHLGAQAPGYGSAMFLKKSMYKIVPSHFMIWFGDDLQVANANGQAYTISSNYIFRQNSTTIRSLAISSRQRVNARILADIENAVANLPFIDTGCAEALKRGFSNYVDSI